MTNENKEVESINMRLWNSVCKTDPAITKGAKIGAMKITAISPQHQRKKATEIFGAYGIGWGIEPESEKFTFNSFGETTLVSYSAIMFYKLDTGYMEENKTVLTLGRFPINAVIKVAYMTQGDNGYLKVDDEYTKKVQTNALTKGLSALGFNSDVFEGKFDDCKYVNNLVQEFAEINKPKVEAITPEQVTAFNAICKNSTYSDEQIKEYLFGNFGFKEALEITTDKYTGICNVMSNKPQGNWYDLQKHLTRRLFCTKGR